jgi:hypothetical protein
MFLCFQVSLNEPLPEVNISEMLPEAESAEHERGLNSRRVGSVYRWHPKPLMACAAPCRLPTPMFCHFRKTGDAGDDPDRGVPSQSPAPEPVVEFRSLDSLKDEGKALNTQDDGTMVSYVSQMSKMSRASQMSKTSALSSATMITRKLKKGQNVLPQWKDPLDPSLPARHFYPEASYPIIDDTDDICEGEQAESKSVSAESDKPVGESCDDDNGTSVSYVSNVSNASTATVVVHKEVNQERPWLLEKDHIT